MIFIVILSVVYCHTERSRSKQKKPPDFTDSFLIFLDNWNTI